MQQSADAEQGSFQAGALAPGATARPGKTPPVFKQILTLEATTRLDRHGFTPRSDGSFDMQKVSVNLSFPNSQASRQVSGAHLIRFEQGHYLLAQSFHQASV